MNLEQAFKGYFFYTLKAKILLPYEKVG